VIHLDTHTLCWLYNGAIDQLSRVAREEISKASVIAIAPVVELELQFLKEIGRFRDTPEQVLQALGRDLGLVVSVTPYRSVVAIARSLQWTHDPFDRLIAAQAICDEAILLTKDRLIRQHCPNALW